MPGKASGMARCRRSVTVSSRLSSAARRSRRSSKSGAGFRPGPPAGTRRASPRTHRRAEPAAAETDLRLKRLYDPIEAGVAELDDPALNELIANLKAIRDTYLCDAGDVRPAGRTWSRGSSGRHASGSGSTAAAIAAIIPARLRSASK